MTSVPTGVPITMASTDEKSEAPSPRLMIRSTANVATALT